MSFQINELGPIHKNKICFNFSLEAVIENYYLENKKENGENESYVDPIFRLLNKIEEIQNYLYDKNMTKFFYLNKMQINKLLYENDEIIFINRNKGTHQLSFLFHLDILINSDKVFINYSYTLNYIENTFALFKEEENNIKKLIISKIIITLIENHKQTDEYLEEEDVKLNHMYLEIEKLINNNILICDLKLNLNDIKTKTIDEIYIDIIIWLIQKDKFEDYDYVSNLMKKLELETINITNIMFNKLLNFFNKKEEYIKYEISKIEDLSDIKKMNFYFCLFKYIIKNPFFIYQIPFLLNIRKIIISFIKSNFGRISIFKKNDDKEKIDYILNKFCDSNYYYKMIHYISENEDYSNSTNISYSIDNEKEKDIYFKILNNSFFDIEIIKTRRKFIYNYKTITYNKNEIIKYKDFMKIKGHIKEPKYLEFIKFLEKLKNNIVKFKEKYKNFNLIIKLKFETNKANNDINCKCELLEKNNSQTIFIDSDIYKDKEFNNLINKLESYFKKENSIDTEFIEKSIIEFLKIISKYEESAEIITELSNGLLVCSSIGHKIEIYDNSFNAIKTITLKDHKDNTYSDSICEINSNDNNIQLFIGSKTDFYLLNLNNFKYKKISELLDGKYCNQFIEVKKENYIMMGINGAFHIKGLFEQNIIIEDIFKTQIYIINGIKINDNLVALSSNSIFKTGKDKLFIYNLNKKTITKEINNFSFINSINGLFLMNINKDLFLHDKVLLCACKKYSSNQKNGILLVEMPLNDDQEIYYEFLDTDFEVFCFCQINEIIKEKINNIEKDLIKETNYFLIGGFCEEKGIGIIYLCKLIFDEKSSHIKIEFIIKVGYINFDEFKSINCIIQSKRTGNIIISCFDGNIYLFKFNGEEIFKHS